MDYRQELLGGIGLLNKLSYFRVRQAELAHKELEIFVSCQNMGFPGDSFSAFGLSDVLVHQ